MAVTVNVRGLVTVLLPAIWEEAAIIMVDVPTVVSAVVCRVSVTGTVLPKSEVTLLGEKLQFTIPGVFWHDRATTSLVGNDPSRFTYIVIGPEVWPRFTVTAPGDGSLKLKSTTCSVSAESWVTVFVSVPTACTLNE